MKLMRLALLLSFTVGILAGTARGIDRGAAEAELKQAVTNGNADGVTKAVDELIDLGGKDSLKAVADMAVQAQQATSIYWQLVGGASGFRDRPALEELGDFIIKHQADRTGISRDLLFGLQNNSSDNAAIPLARVLKDGKFDLQLVAADQLATVRSADAVDALIAALKKEEKGDPQLKDRIHNALVILCGDDQGDSGNWDGWWKVQRSKGVPPKKEGGAGGTGIRGGDIKKFVTDSDPKHIIVLSAESPGTKPETNDFDYDHMESILDQFKIPHTVVKRLDFEKDPDSYLKGAYAVLINCHQINDMCVCPDCQGGPQGNLTNRLGACNPKCHVHIIKNYALKQPTLDRLKSWVENEGGYLYTEDWGLAETTAKCWPDLVGTGGAKEPVLVRKQTADKKGFEQHISVKLVPVPGVTSHPLMRGVWQKAKPDPQPAGPSDPNGGTKSRVESPAKPLEHQWQVDDESPAIEIKDAGKVTTLLMSDELDKVVKDWLPSQGGDWRVVAITFRVGNGAPPAPKDKPKINTGGGGKERGAGDWSTGAAMKGGRVLHTMSHFGHQSQDEDGQALYNLLLNFLTEAGKRHGG
jgi:hypothetical protein